MSSLVDLIPDWCFVLLFPFTMLLCFLFIIMWIVVRVIKDVLYNYTDKIT